MATTNINKIVRGGNLNFKPWIAAKNTTDIVNGYVQKFYKQIPDNFKNDLMKPRMMSSPKIDNRFPLRKVVPEKFNIPIISNKTTSKLRSNGYRSPAMTVKNSFIATPPKKLLKIPNLKIYTRRRYASSISSSKSSFIRSKPNNNDEYRKKIYTPAQEIQFQTIRGVQDFPGTKYNETPRLFNALHKRTKTVEASKAICNNLMSIDDLLRKKISIVKQKPPSVELLEPPKQHLLKLAFKDWNHPSIEHYNKLTALPNVKKTEKWKNRNLNSELSSFVLMPVKRNYFTGKVSKLGRSPRNTLTRLQSLLGSSHSKRFTGAAAMKEKNIDRPLSMGSNGGVKYMDGTSTRYFRGMNNPAKTVIVSKAICNDLMSIDDVLKKKICIVKQKPPSVEPPEIPKQNVLKFSFKSDVCNKGSPNSGLSSFQLMSVKRKPFSRKVSNTVPAPRKANTKLQPLDSIRFKRFNDKKVDSTQTENNTHQSSASSMKSKFESFKLCNPSEEKLECKNSYNPQGAMEFLCVNQANQYSQSGNKGGLQGNLRY